MQPTNLKSQYTLKEELNFNYHMHVRSQAKSFTSIHSLGIQRTKVFLSCQMNVEICISNKENPVMLSCHTIMKPHPIPIPNLLTNHIPSYSMTAWHENGTENPVMLSCHTIMKPHPIPIPNPNLLTNHIPSYFMTAWHENGTENPLSNSSNMAAMT
jgi:hypothetical protein